MGLIANNDETLYRKEIQHLSQWCSLNHLVLNTSKTNKVIVVYRRCRRTVHPPITIQGYVVECVDNIKFLGTHITSDLTWLVNKSFLVMKAQHGLFILRKLKMVELPAQLLKNFYRDVI